MQIVDSNLLLNISLIYTLLAIFFLGLVPLKFKSSVASFTVLINAGITSFLAVQALNGNLVDIILYSSPLFGDIPLRIDPLSAWFILLINFTSLTGIFYGNGYLKAYQTTNSKINLHYFSFILFHLSMLWVSMLQHSLAFLLAWEIMSLSSMLLVIFDHEKASTIKAGINYLVQMHLSVILLSIGFIWVYFQTGSFSFDAMHSFFGVGNNLWLFLIFFAGFGIKAGFIPLHTWLPYAHPAAPSHVSGVMSGVIVKLGIYGLFRIITFLKADFLILGELLISISVLTGIFGILNAAVNRDYKRMLAYCTIENIGIIGIGIGLGLIGMGLGSAPLYFLGFGGALLHVLNHSLFKSLLFFSAGSVYRQTHTRDMEKLGGLIKYMPKTASLFLIGAIAISGIPPFSGFVSEFLLYSGLIKGLSASPLNQMSLLVLSIASLSLIGGLAVLTFTKTFGIIFLGSPRSTFEKPIKEVPLSMLLPQYLIVAVMISIAMIPKFYLNILSQILQNLNPAGNFFGNSNLSDFANPIANINIYFLILIGIVILIWQIRKLALKSKRQVIESTWGCGYAAPNTRMQYTGKSFSKSLGKIFNFIMIEEKQFTELTKGEIFPQRRHHSSAYFDIFEYRIIDIFTDKLLLAVNYFKFIQNGRVQSYVLYGILFMLVVFLLTILNIVK